MVNNFEIDLELKNSLIDTGNEYDFDIDLILMRFKKIIYKKDLVEISY